jgi:hypothetical protein
MTEFKEIRQLFAITENFGFSVAEISEYKKICDSIPKVLEDYYAQLGKIEALNHTQNELVEPSRLVLSKNQDFLIFCGENQWVCFWGIDKNDLSMDNPPIYISYDNEVWTKETECLTDFLNATASVQAIFALPFGSGEFVSISREEFEIFEKKFKKRDFALPHWAGTHFYGNHDNEVIMIQQNEDHYDMFYASNDKKRYKEMNKILSKLG